MKTIAIIGIVLLALFDYAMCVMCIGMENTRDNACDSRVSHKKGERDE